MTEDELSLFWDGYEVQVRYELDNGHDELTARCRAMMTYGQALLDAQGRLTERLDTLPAPPPIPIGGLE